MINKAFHLVYLILSKIPDVYFLGKYLKKIRACVLSLQSNKMIGENCKISYNVKIWASTSLVFGDNCEIKDNVILSGKITLGENCHILSSSFIDGTGGVTVGDFTHIGRANQIYSHNHDIYNKNEKVIYSKEIFLPVNIGNDVMLFSNVSIMAGITIQDGTVVAFGSIVTKDTKKYGIYAGIPAKMISERK